MRARSSLLLLTLTLWACASPPAPPSEQAADAPPPAAAEPAPTHLGGCILTSPQGQVPEDVYTTTDIVPTAEYLPFAKKLTVYGLTLVARDDVDDEFLQLVARAIRETFPRGDGIDTAAQAAILRNHYRYNAVIPVPQGEDMSFVEENEAAWRALESQNSICDIIMAGVAGQVMEVVEHILHYVSDIGLHYAFPDEWGLAQTSVLRRAMDEAIEKGYYDVSSYDDIDDPDALDRVLMQEFAYWVISTAWNLQEPYGSQEDEWTIRNEDDLKTKLPELYAAFERTVGRTMAPRSRETLQAIGPTRAEERQTR